MTDTLLDAARIGLGYAKGVLDLGRDHPDIVGPALQSVVKDEVAQIEAAIAAAEGGEVGGWKMDEPIGTVAGNCTIKCDGPRQNSVLLSFDPDINRYDLLLQLKAFEMAIVDVDDWPPQEPGDG